MNKANNKAETTYTDWSDRSFLIEDVGGKPNLFRVKYGHVWQKDENKR